MKHCMVCDSELISTIYLDQEYMDICNDCGYGRPSLRDPIQYGDEYESKYLSYPENEICKIRLFFVKQAKRSADISIHSILDYGCGSGSFVKAARKEGYTAFGYDINDYTSDIRPSEEYSPEIITAWDSFEHLTDEQQEDFFKCADNAKIILISVPDFNTPKKDLSLKDWRHYRPREHLHYYTVKSLCFRFEREGYRLAFSSHEEDIVRKAPWKNNILTVGFIKG